MPLPPFDERGLLPPGEHDIPHRCTITEVEHALVAAFGSPQWRVEMMAGWLGLRRLVEHFAPGATWWLWGSLTTGLAEPRWHPDAVWSLAFLPYGALPGPDLLGHLLGLFPRALQDHNCNASWLIDFPPGDDRQAATIGEVEFKHRRRASTWVHGDDPAHVGFIEVAP